MKQEKIRVRIAPSPTGYFHIGSARTALSNWLFAKKNGGKFILRIEDTDLERSEKKFEEDIIKSLKWLGLEWDEGPFRQTDRLDIYEKYIKQLLKEGKAYYCFCSKEELEVERQAMLAQGFAPKYSGKCRKLTAEEVESRQKSQANSVIRFHVPETNVRFDDIIRGDVSFDGSLIGDIVIAKDLRSPLYNFAVVIDDYDMEISHVIRGEEHLANTPRQIFIQEALGFPRVKYAHLPLILNADRSKMSKRFSATSLKDYIDQGYLAEAIINFIAFLGWHPKDDKEIMSVDELIKEFNLERVQKAGAVFNVEKLDWLNAQYIKNLDNEKLAKKLDLAPTEENLKIIALTKERMKKMTDFKSLAGFFLELPDYSPKLLVWKDTPQSKIIGNLKELEKLLSEFNEENFNKPELEKILMPFAEKTGRGEVLWPLRAALSGSEASPGPLEIMDVLGKKETLRRIKLAIDRLIP